MLANIKGRFEVDLKDGKYYVRGMSIWIMLGKKMNVDPGIVLKGFFEVYLSTGSAMIPRNDEEAW